MKKLLCALLTIFLLAGLTCITHAATTDVGVEPGQPMPDFTVETTDGGTVTLSEVLKEKDLVVLNVFATWCGPCKMEFPEMERTYQAHSDQMEIISVSGDPEDTMQMVADFKKEHGLTFPMGVAGNNISFLKPPGFPTTVFIDRNGNVGFIKAGGFPEGTFEEKVNVFLSADYDGTPLDSEIAKGGFGLMVLGAIALGLVQMILFVIGRWRLFIKAGKPGWHSIIPFLSTYEEYSLCWNGVTGILAGICLAGIFIFSFITTRVQADWAVLATSAIGIVYLVLTLIENFKLSKAFGKGIGFGIVLIIFKAIGRLILGFGKAEYQG